MSNTATEKTKKELQSEINKLEREKQDLVRAKEEFDKAVQFAEALRQNVYNVSANTRVSVSYQNFTKENIESWLKNPTSNEKNLRNASKYIYDISLHYKRLCLYYSGLGAWEYIMYPYQFDSENVSTKNVKSLRKAFLDASLRLEKFDLKYELYKDFEIALKEGAFYGILIEDKDTFFIQKLDPDICQIVTIEDGCWNFAIDCSQIKEADLDIYYDETVHNLWQQYQATGQKFQEVPSEVSFCIKPDESSTRYTIPFFASVMPQLYMIAAYEQLQETSEQIQNYKLIACTVPVDEEGVPRIDWTLALKYYQHLCNNLPDFIGAAITPFDVKEFKFDQTNGVAAIDVVSRAVAQYWQEVGTPSAIHGAGKETATGLKYATKTDELIAIKFMQQGQKAVNRILKKIKGSQKFQIEFLPVTIFNREEWLSKYKESVAFGIGKSQYCAALGISPYKLATYDFVEMNLLGFDSLTPMLNSYTTAAEDLIGRPHTDVPSEKTIINKESET